METTYLIATAGLKLPVDRQPGQFITDGKAVPVTLTHYYQRALNDGDVRLATEEEIAALTAASPAVEEAAPAVAVEETVLAATVEDTAPIADKGASKGRNA